VITPDVQAGAYPVDGLLCCGLCGNVMPTGHVDGVRVYRCPPGCSRQNVVIADLFDELVRGALAAAAPKAYRTAEPHPAALITKVTIGATVRYQALRLSWRSVQPPETSTVSASAEPDGKATR